MWQTQSIICFYSTWLDITAEGENRAKNNGAFLWASDMIYNDFNIHLLSPCVCDLNRVWWLLKQASQLRGPMLWVKGQDRQAKEFLKASVKAVQRAVWYYDVWICPSVCTFVLFPYTCTYVLKCLCVNVATCSRVTCVIKMTCERRRLRWWNRFGNRCLCVYV